MRTISEKYWRLKNDESQKFSPLCNMYADLLKTENQRQPEYESDQISHIIPSGQRIDTKKNIYYNWMNAVNYFQYCN